MRLLKDMIDFLFGPVLYPRFDLGSDFLCPEPAVGDAVEVRVIGPLRLTDYLGKASPLVVLLVHHFNNTVFAAESYAELPAALNGAEVGVLHQRLGVGRGPVLFNGVLIETDDKTKVARSIRRLDIDEESTADES